MGLWRRSKIPEQSPLAAQEQISRVAVHAGYLWGRLHNEWSRTQGRDELRLFPGIATEFDGTTAVFMPERQLLRPLEERVGMAIHYAKDGNVVISSSAYQRFPLDENDILTLVTKMFTLAPGTHMGLRRQEGRFHGGVFCPLRDAIEVGTDTPLTERNLKGISDGLNRVAHVPLSILEAGLSSQPDMPHRGTIYGTRRDVA